MSQMSRLLLAGTKTFGPACNLHLPLWPPILNGTSLRVAIDMNGQKS